jgi:hypothetical protein
MNDADVTARLAETLANHDGGPDWWAVTDEEERASHRRTAAALLPVVRDIANQRAAEVWALAASWVGPPFEQEFRDRAAALRGNA